MIALAGCGRHAPSDKQTAVPRPGLVTLTPAQMQHIGLYTVGAGTFAKSIDATGVVDFDNNQATSVVAPMSGPVVRLLADVGQTVRAGQPLALVDSPDYATAVTTFEKADVTARNARRIADVDKDLVLHNGVSAREAQQAQTDAANAEADRASALQALVALQLTPQAIRDAEQGRVGRAIEGEMRAPISGTVVEKLITPGELLQAGSTASFTIANLSRMWVMAQVTPGELAAIRVGDPAEIQTSAGARLDGVVDNISAEVNPDTRAVLARIVVANPAGVLRKQMYVQVHIRSRQATSGILAPVSAILRDDVNLPFVYVEASNGGFARRHVTLGGREGDFYQILSGLNLGERVVSDGGLFLQFIESQ